MIDFIVDNLLLLPFLFLTYLALEAIEGRAGEAFERLLERAYYLGPFFGSLVGAFPQCGFSAAAASFFSGGVISVGTLIAVFLSTSDELIPVLISSRAPAELVFKIVLLKVICGIVCGFAVNSVLAVCGRNRSRPHVAELCKHSHCGCKEHHGILVPALIHTCEIFVFILIVSGAVELSFHYLGENAFKSFIFNRPFIGEALAGLVGMIPNCAVSVSCAKLYLEGGMSAGALMASSLSGSGVGLLVLLRINRNWRMNLAVIASVYGLGTLVGWICGLFF